MAANTVPVFTNKANVGAGLTSTTSQAALQGNALTSATSLLTGGTNGTRVNEIDVTPTGTSLVGTVNLFLVDGSANFWLFDQVPLLAVTLTTGTAQALWKKSYPNLIVPTGWTLQATQTCAGTQIVCAVLVLGEDF